MASSNVVGPDPSKSLGFGFKQFSLDHREQVSPGMHLHVFGASQALMPCWFSFALSSSAHGPLLVLTVSLKALTSG